MKTIAITVSGGFHNAGCITVRAKVRKGRGNYLIADLNERQMHKIFMHMCGLKDCACGGGYGDIWEAPEGWERTERAEWALDVQPVTE